MRKTIAAVLVYLVIIGGVGIAATTQAEAHTPHCHYGTVYPYMYLRRVVSLYGNPWIYYTYYYINVNTANVHHHECKVFTA